MMRTRLGERLPLGNKPAGERFVGFSGVQSGAGKRQASIPSVTGAPSHSAHAGNQALPGKPSRGFATNFGARGIAPFRPGSSIGTKTAYQPLTIGRPMPFLETRMPAQEAVSPGGFVREPEMAPDARGVDNGTMNKLSKVTRRKLSRSSFPQLFGRATGTAGGALDPR